MPEKRPPASAGQFYPASKKDLRKEIEGSFTHSLGPGAVPDRGSGEERILGGVVPHAGYRFSGPVAAHVYSALARNGLPENIIILGPKHPDPFRIGSAPEAAVTMETFKMPMGDVPVNEDLAEMFLDDSIEADPDVHASEHSIEVQLPFLQYFSDSFEIIPICISSQSFEIAEEIGDKIAALMGNEDVAVIASTDFTHCGSRYNQKPPEGVDAAEFAQDQDEKAIDRILDLDAKGLSSVVEENNITMCGPAGVEALILGLEDRVEGGNLLKYSTSAEVASGDSAVGYGGIVFG